MSTTLAQDRKSLRIFESFEVDWELQKWKNREREGANLMMYNNITRRNGGGLVQVNPAFGDSGNFVISGNVSIMPTAAGGIAISGDKKAGLLERIFGKNKRQKELEKKLMAEMQQSSNFTIEAITETEVIPEITVEEFFTSVKNSVEELVLVKEKVDGYTAALDRLKKLGQVSLYEAMALDVEMYRAEAQMYATGMTKYLSEDNIVKFLKKSPKALRLDWIKNFVRIIPDEVADKKLKADELMIFDNYVILHYDPDGKGNQMTSEEIAKKKDPVLFGVVIGSRKLYYIGDWIDEYCDLTLEKIIEHLGEGALQHITKETELWK